MPISQGNAHGPGAVVFGMLFITIGIYIAGVGFEIFEVDPRKIHAPLIFIKLFGGIFAAAGAYVSLGGLKDMAFERRMANLKRMAPHEPWSWDFEWNPGGIGSRIKLNQWGSHIVGISVTSVFLYFTYWLGFIQPNGVKFPFYGMCFFALLMALFFVKPIWQKRRYGEGFLEFGTFPFRLGQTMRVTATGLPVDKNIESVQVTLQFCQEEYTGGQTTAHKSDPVHLHVIYEDVQDLPASVVQAGRLAIEFSIPNEKEWASKVSARPASFWELCIDCKMTGFDYSERYLIPIY